MLTRAKILLLMLVAGIVLHGCNGGEAPVSKSEPAGEARTSPPWVQEAVIYEVYPRSFSPEGTFDGIRARLAELKALGVTVVWLMPIHPIGQEKRKGTLGSPYSIKDYYAINPEFGTLKDFKALVAAVHDADMRIIIDLVVNHTAWDNPLIEEHPDWYSHDAGGNIVAPNDDWTDVADLNYDNPGLRQYMLDMILYWVRDVGIDGYRCDVAEMVPLDFWETVRAELDEIKPVLLLAEGSAPELHRKVFDITYAWNVYHTLTGIFQRDESAKNLAEVVQEEQAEFHENSLRLRFTSNHDENAWRAPAAELFGLEGAKAAAVAAFGLPGVPLIYNGQEVGNTTRLPLFERVPIDWQQDPHGFRTFYTDLLRVRRQSPALLHGGVEFLDTGYADSVVAFYREHHGQRILVVSNLKDVARRIPLPAADRNLKKLFGNGNVQGGEILLPAFGYFIAEVE